MWSLEDPVKVPEGPHTNVKGPSVTFVGPSGPTSAVESPEKAPAPVAVIGGEARKLVLGSLSASFGMTAQVIAQSVPKRHRDQTAVILDAFVTEGIATVDASGKYMKRENVA